MMETELQTTKVLEAVQAVFNCCPTVMHNELLSHVELREVQEEKIFIKEGDVCDGIYIVIEGSLKLFLKREKRDQVFLFKTVNDIIGLQSVVSQQPYDFNAATMERAILAFIPAFQIGRMLHQYPNAFFSLMKKVNEKASAMEMRSSLMMTDNAERVVVKTIEDLKNRFGIDSNGYIKLHIPVKDLASYVCMSKTNLYRVLQTLKEKMILTHHLDKYRLEQPVYSYK